MHRLGRRRSHLSAARSNSESPRHRRSGTDRTSRGRIGVRLVAVVGTLLGVVGYESVGAQEMGDVSENPGRDVYEASCVGCHQAGGRGVEGIFPSLRDNELIQGPPEALLIVVLEGRSAMPGFGESLSNQEIAAVLSYLRTNWGNDAERIPKDEIAEIRKHLSTADPQAQNGG